jgi:hypothetical protein
VSKEATVERETVARIYGAMLEALKEADLEEQEYLRLGQALAYTKVAVTLANAEQAAAAKAWDEGFAACIYDPIHGPKSRNPYRPEPAKGDGK